jgi:hypothetical protein
MTDIPDPKEVLEQAELSAHAGHSQDKLTMDVTLSIAMMAVVAAFIGALGETEESHTFVEKNDAVLAQARASDAWTEYQAESLKRHVYDVGSAIAVAPDVVSRLKDQADKYNGEQPATQDKAKKLEAEVADRSAKADTHFERHHVLTFAEGMVHVAIAAASVSLLARRRVYWYASLGLTMAGIVVAAAAYVV